MELVDGEIIVMTPSGYESDEVASEFSGQLRNWVKPRKLGRVTGAGAGFNLCKYSCARCFVCVGGTVTG
jgi:Uma2 family endonuclease